MQNNIGFTSKSAAYEAAKANLIEDFLERGTDAMAEWVEIRAQNGQTSYYQLAADLLDIDDKSDNRLWVLLDDYVDLGTHSLTGWEGEPLTF